MKARTGMGLSAAALAWLCLSPDAFAVGQPQPGINLTYSAETVALSSGGNTAPIQTLDYTTKTGTTLAAGNAVTWSAPAGNNWAIQGGTICRSNPGAVLGVLTGGGTNNLTCT